MNCESQIKQVVNKLSKEFLFDKKDFKAITNINLKIDHIAKPADDPVEQALVKNKNTYTLTIQWSEKHDEDWREKKRNFPLTRFYRREVILPINVEYANLHLLETVWNILEIGEMLLTSINSPHTKEISEIEIILFEKKLTKK